MNDTMRIEPIQLALFDDTVPDDMFGAHPPALLVGADGQLYVNAHAPGDSEVYLVQGDLVDGWEVPRTGCYTLRSIITGLDAIQGSSKGN